METKSMKQHMGMRAANTISNTISRTFLIISKTISCTAFYFIIFSIFRICSR